MVCYPLLDLHKHKKDLHWYTTALEETVIQTLNRYQHILSIRYSPGHTVTQYLVVTLALCHTHTT